MLVEKHQQTYWVLKLPRQYFSIKRFWKQLYHTFSDFYIDQEQNQIQKYKYPQLYHTFLESYSIQEQILLQKGKYRHIYYTSFNS